MESHFCPQAPGHDGWFFPTGIKLSTPCVLGSAERQLTGDQGQPSLLILVVFIWEQSLDIQNFRRHKLTFDPGCLALFHKESKLFTSV